MMIVGSVCSILRVNESGPGTSPKSLFFRSIFQLPEKLGLSAAKVRLAVRIKRAKNAARILLVASQGRIRRARGGRAGKSANNRESRTNDPRIERRGRTRSRSR